MTAKSTRYASLSPAPLLCSCASAPRVAPRFTAPDTKPIAEATGKAKRHVEDARKTVRIIERECPDAAPQINALNASLDGALGELATSEGARIQLQDEL